MIALCLRVRKVCECGRCEGGGCKQEASVNLLMKKNNTAIKASQKQVKHSCKGANVSEGKGARSISRARAGLDLCEKWELKRVNWREGGGLEFFFSRVSQNENEKSK